MKTTVIYHSADFDGIFCREIAHKFLPEADLIGWDFGNPPLDPALLATPIVVLDLPIDQTFGIKFKGGWVCRGDEQVQPIDRVDTSNIIWIDHHKSSIESHPTSIPGYRIDGVAACRLAWQWFLHHMPQSGSFGSLPHKDAFVKRMVSEPAAVRLAGEYDIWDKRDPNAEAFQFGLRSKDLSDQDWNELLSGYPVTALEATGMVISEGDVAVSSLLQAGRMLQRYQQRTDEGVAERSFKVSWEGLTFLALNTARCNSLTFASKDVPETGHDALLGFYFDGDQFKVSLYHANHRKDLDLSQIAVKYGGGGHRGACGFRCKLPAFVK